MARRMMVAILMLFLVTTGCTTTGTRTAQPPPTPVEAKILAMTAISIAINVKKMNPTDLYGLQNGLLLAETAILTILSDDPAEVHAFDIGTVKGLNPLYQDLISDMLQVAILRIRPYIDGDNPDIVLAREYIEATIDGGMAGINRARTRLEP